MKFTSFASAIAFGLLASAPISAAYVVTDSAADKRHVGSLASLASKLVRDVLPAIEARQEPDAYGPWDSDSDEYGSWVDKVKREPEPHHTEAQIAAKEKAAKAKNNQKRHHTEAQIAAKEKAAAQQAGNSAATTMTTSSVAAATTTPASTCNKKRHHTEAQIAAKEKAAAQAQDGCDN